LAYRHGLFCIQEQSTGINVKNYWPSVVASGAMLLATDALSIERTLGSHMLSSCDISKPQIAEFAYLQGSSDFLLDFAKTYDDRAGRMLNQRVVNTWLQGNVTKLRQMMLEDNFGDTCKNLSQDERTRLVVAWADDIQIYILAVDEIRGSYVLPYILQVKFSYKDAP